MVRQLEEYPNVNYSPGFAIPQRSIPFGPPQNTNWSPWVGNPTGTSPPQPSALPSNPRFSSSSHSAMAFSPVAQPVSQGAAPALTAPIPTIATLQPGVANIHNPNYDPALKIAWARDVISLVDRSINTSSSTDPPVGPAVIDDPALLRLAQLAVPTILQIASSNVQPLPPHVAEAVYLRATLAASGAYPEHIPHNPRVAFRDFESSARAGYAAAWFRLGRDYENFNDVTHARDCFERGVKLGVESCAYRMGMAHLMGQLGLQPNPSVALPLLHRAATLATVTTPQPAYIFALLLLGEFTSLPSPLPASAFAPFVSAGSSVILEVRKHLERAAYLGFPPAQYKLGHAYEFAQPPFPFDPLLSVQYYSLASQQGEVEADMALSKWFLCGSGGGEGEEGGFEKDEGLAFSFAEKAAKKGLASAEFAMGYYAEVGAQLHGNNDATERLNALSQPSPDSLSRQQHDSITENKLVRKRTQAKQRSSLAFNTAYNMQQQAPQQQGYPASQGNDIQQPLYPGQQGQPQGIGRRPDDQRIPDKIRQNSGGYPGAQSPGGALTPAQQYQQQYQQSRPGQQYPSPPPGQGGRHPVHAQTQPRPGPGAGRRPQSAGGPGGAPAHRYTLVDSPAQPQGGNLSARPGGGGRFPSAGYVGSPPGPPQDDHDDGPVTPPGVTLGLGGGHVYAPKPSKGPATFAEMGIQSAKAEDKECIVM
ncbi:hypothetical protein H0H81_007927 [Sphagnurus paluster]|uniref:HCP-like protein n=1 Tax=Sphagnurus paluster TaxID=117069 RepID=A0A9P7FXP4_9AGAR|nr:hypothetical protein H0H81_007927 [Sphagnurus paluster]